MNNPMTGGPISTPEPPPKDLRLRFWWLRTSRQLLFIGLALCLSGLLCTGLCFVEEYAQIKKPLPEASEPNASVRFFSSVDLVHGLFSLACGILAIDTSRRFRKAAFVESHDQDSYVAALQSLWGLLFFPMLVALVVLFPTLFVLLLLFVAMGASWPLLLIVVPLSAVLFVLVMTVIRLRRRAA
jgi:hypothetical protein